MQVDDVDGAALRRGQRGLRDAVARFEQARQTHDADYAMVSSTEACMWACSMDELLWPVDQYKTLRDSDADGQVVNGPWLFESGLIDVLSEPAGLV